MTPPTLPTLPGDLPGLLRRGSPCIFALPDAGRHDAGDVCVVVASGGGGVLVATNRRAFVEVNAAALLLDLSDATGRIHAAWWLDRQHPPAEADTRWFERRRGWLMGGIDAEGLRDACLRVAGRAA